MRRLALALVLSCAAAGAPALAAGGGAPLAEQSVVGTITAPVPSNVTGVPRRAALASAATNGLIGHYFPVDQSTVGGTFDLAKGADPTGTGDLNIVFYSNAGDVAQGAPTAAGEFYGADIGGEKGIVPEGAKTGLVFISGGARVGFTYKAVPATLVSLAGSSLDATVVKGAPVRFLNDTRAPLTVVSDTNVFDTGELAPGGAASVVVETAGRYPFAVGNRTGVLTVTG